MKANDRELTNVVEDDFSVIRDRHEKQNIESKLRRTLFGGYSPKGVHMVIMQYKDTLDLMQNSFEGQLRDLRAEMERVFNERSVLKQQLDKELEKSKEVEASRAQIEMLLSHQEDLESEKQKALDDARRSQEEYARLDGQYREMVAKTQETQEQADAAQKDVKKLEEMLQLSAQENEKLREQLENPSEMKMNADVGSNTDSDTDSDTVLQLRKQLAALTEYNESLEKQQASLEAQISSLRVINQELEKLSEEYKMHKEEMQEYRVKCLNLRQENDNLMFEMESTGSVLAEILEQMDDKERECEELRARIAQQSEQVVAMMKEKLELQSSQVDLAEAVYRLETQLQESKVRYEQTNLQLEEMRRYLSGMEKGKGRVIQMPVIGENGQPAVLKSEQKDEPGLLEKARITAERLKQKRNEEDEKPEQEMILG